MLDVKTDVRIAVTACMVVLLALVQGACVNIEPEAPAQAPVIKNKPQSAMEWLPLVKDKIHDPESPMIGSLQEPAEALSTLPGNKLRMNVGTYRTVGLAVNTDGNKVDWVQAVKDGLISPRRSLDVPASGVEREQLVMDMDIFLDMNGSMPIVRFPHLAHTMWLACSNCHPSIFVPQAGANQLSMERILSGEQCGICHRAVAFPPTDCARCHSIRHNSPEGMMIKAEARAKASLKEKTESAPPTNTTATALEKTIVNPEATVEKKPTAPKAKKQLKAKKSTKSKEVPR